MGSILIPDNIHLKVEVANKNEMLRYLSDKICKETNLSEDFILEILTQREEQLTTGIGEGIAIPHAFNEKVKGFHILFCTTKNRIEYHSIDKKPVNIFICICANPSENLRYLKIIAKFAEMLHNPTIKAKISDCEKAEDLLPLFEKMFA